MRESQFYVILFRGVNCLKDYFKTNAVPILIESVFIISCFIIPKEYFIYTNFLFYFALLIYFLIKKDISIKKWFDSLKCGKKFWKQVLYTMLGLVCAFALSTALENMFPTLNTGMIKLKTDTWFKLVVFSAATIFLPAIVEETFFRKNMIVNSSKKTLIITTLISMFLFGLEHSLSVWGIFLTMIWALPLSIAYIKTENIYVSMTAHFVANLLGNGITIIFIII